MTAMETSRAAQTAPREPHGLRSVPVPEQAERPRWSDGEERRSPSTRGRTSWAGALYSPVDTAARTTARVGRRRRAWERRYSRWSSWLDALTMSVAVAFGLGLSGSSPGYAVAVGVLASVVQVLLTLVLGGYSTGNAGSGPEEYQSVVRATAALTLATGFGSFLLDANLSRWTVAVVLPMGGLCCLLVRWVVRRALHARRRRGQAMLRAVLVGDPATVRPVHQALVRRPSEGYQVVGLCTPRQTETTADLQVLGAVADVPEVALEVDADVVIVVGGALTGEGLRRLSWATEAIGARLVVAPGVVEVSPPRMTHRSVAGLSMLHLEPVAYGRGHAIGKTVLDCCLGAALFVLSVPVVVLCALLVRLDSPGPMFFPQQRVGREGRRFTMYKLRTMVDDAEARRGDVLGQSDRDGMMFKMRRDPRVTRVGRLLRRFSIDELPQLLNVVKGDMSLVGPRPPLPEEVDGYRDAVVRRLHVKPGLTGLWQVSGRADLPWEESVRLDLHYVDNCSIMLDLMILWRTGRAVLTGSGAY